MKREEIGKEQKKKGVEYIKHTRSEENPKEKITVMEMLTPNDVRERLFVGKSKVYEILRSGTLKSVRIGRQYRVTESALEDYLKEHQWENYEISK